MIREHKSLHRAALDQDYVDECWERKYTLKDLSMGSPNSVSLGVRATKRESGLRGGAIVPAFLEAWKIKVLL